MENTPENAVKKRVIAPFFAANGFIYALLALYYSFAPKYLDEVAGKSESQIGIILSAGPLVGIISMFVFGVAADKAKYKNNVLIIIIIISAAAFYMIRLSDNIAYLIFVFSVFMFFLSPFGGLLDAVSLEYTTAAGIKYGPMRVMGSLAFGLISLGLTLAISFFKDYADVKIIFPVYALMALFAAVSVKKIPPVKGHAQGKNKISYREFFRDKVCITLFVLIFAMQFAFGSYLNFTQNYLENELNQPSWIWGMTVFVMVFSEMIFFAKFEYFFRRFSVKQVIIFGVFMQVVRYLCFALLPYGTGILITSLITGAFPTAMMYAGAYYINMTVRKEMRASGQTLMYAVSVYVPRFLAGVVGGFTIDYLGGYSSLMFICAGLNLVLLIASGFMPFKDPRENLTGK
jgi:predicted MFS family arabinose efflux permease